MQIVFDPDRIELDVEALLRKRKPITLESVSLSGAHSILLAPPPPTGGLIAYGLEPGRSAYTTPHYCTTTEEIPKDTYLAIWQHQAGYVALLALSHSGITARLSGDPNGVVLQLEGANGPLPCPVAISCYGEDIHSTLQLVMAEALQRTGNIGKLRRDKPGLPPWLGRIGWESGLAFGCDISHDLLVKAISNFQEGGVRLGYVLIDEGWQEVSHTPQPNSLLSFEADPSRFPEGLEATTTALSRLGIRHIGVWHGLMGARGGLHSDLARRYDLPSHQEGHYLLGDHLGHTFQFYFDYYDALKRAGVTFVKVGDQGHPMQYRGECDVTRLYKNLQIALQAASSIQFNNAHLNAECLCNENLFYWSTSRIARAGRNFHPSHTGEVFQTIRDHLSNALWLYHLMQPDFDTWATTSTYCETAAIFHALSGSMNAVSDRMGEQRLPLLRKLALPSGRMVTADQPLVPCEDSIFHDPLHERIPYKASTRVRECGIVGLLNLYSEERSVQGNTGPNDVLGLTGEIFAAHSLRNGFQGILHREESIACVIKPGQPDILSFAPIRHDVALIGCHLFYIARATVVDYQVDEEALHITSMVAGPTLLYCTREVLEVRRNGQVVPWTQNLGNGLLCLDARKEPIELACHYVVTFIS